MTIDYKFLGKRIKSQRQAKGKTQENFAEYLNVSVGYISQIERGITKVSLERLMNISEYLNCSISFLLEGTNLKEETYLTNEFNELFQKLSVSEKRTLTLLVKEYLNIRGDQKNLMD